MDSSESSLVSGDLTSTMENVSVTNDQGESSSKSESTYVGDSVPSSSSDANVQATVLKAVLDDPISSTSDTINSVSEMNLKSSACDVHLELGAAESEGGASNVSELVTDTDFFSSELNIGSICTEKISEDVEDIANDLENLLGESSHEYSISSNTDKSFDLDPFESHSKTTFEGATQTKDITTTDTSENALINPEKLESVSSDKTLFEEESFSTAGAMDTIGHSAGPSGNADQITESENVSASASENVEEFSKPDIKCAGYTEFAIQEVSKPEIVAEDDQSDDEEVYGMILQIRDDNQDSTTGDEARTEEDSQESLPQRDWSVKTPTSEETPTSNVDLTCINTDIGNDQVCAGFQNQDTTSKESFSLFEAQKESGDELEIKDRENKITVDSQPDKPDVNASDFVEESVPEEEEDNNDTNRESDLIKIQITEVSDKDESFEHGEDPTDCAAEKLLKNDNESGEVTSDVIENAVFSLEDAENENKIETENAEEERADDERKLFEIAEDQPEEQENVSNHLETTSVEDLTATGAGSVEVTQQSIGSIDSDIVTKLTEESENLNVKESDRNFTNTLDENEENIDLIAEDDDKDVGTIVQDDDEKEEDGIADVGDVIKSESLNADDVQSTSVDFKSLGDCTDENNGQTDVEVSAETLNVADETAEHSEDKIAPNTEEFIKESECPKPGPLPDLNEFQVNSFGECDKKEDTTKNDLLDTEAVISMETEDTIEENLIQSENGKLRDSVPDGEVQSKSEESPKETSALFTSFEDLVKESLNEEAPDVTQSILETVDCLTDTGNCNTMAEELAEIQFSVTSEQEHIHEPHNKEITSDQVENQLITADSEQERPCESDNKAAGGSIQLVDVEEDLEMKDASFHSNDNTDLEKTETNESTDVKLTESAEDSNLITNDANVPQISSASEVNDETISLELKVLQSLEESVEAICAISKEETANKETEGFFQESENSEAAKFAALDDVEILEASGTIELQKEERDESFSVDVECFNSAQFVAEVQSVEDCVELQIDGGSTQNKVMLPDNEPVDVETQDGLLADELLQKEIENLEEQNVVFPILEDNFEDAIESHRDIENVQQSDLTKLSEADDQFEVNEACKYIEANDINADETQDSEETIIETIELQLVEDDKDSVEQTEEYESISATEDVADPKVEEELTQNSADNESTSLSNVIVEEADEQTVKPEEGNGNAKKLESVCIEEIPDGAVMTEIEPTIVEPLIDMPEEEEAPSEVSSSLIIETEPQSKGEKSYQQSPNADERKRQDPEYSSKMSSDQDLKMTIRKHRIEDTQKYESEGTTKSESILKIFDSHESIDDKEKDPVPRLIIKPIVKPSAAVEEVEHVVPKITIKPILGRSSPSEAQLSPKMMKAANRPDSPKVTRSQKCDMLSPLKLTIKPVLKPEEMQQQKSSPKLTIKPIQKVDESSVSSPKITIKPIIKPSEEDVVHSPKITIKPIVKPPEQECEMLLQSPRITIKPVVKPTDSPKKSPERDHSPRITIKPIVKPAEEKIAKDSTETSHNPRITIKPLIKPEESKSERKQDGSKKTEQEMTSAETSSHSPRITIKPIVKPLDEQKQSKQESSTGSPKITIKPIVRPQEVDEDSVRLIDFEEEIKQERIVLKINKTTKSTRKRQAADATEKLAKIKVKYSRERGRAQIVSEQGKLKRALEGSFDPDFKRTRFESGDLTITPINPVVQIEKIETPLPVKSGVTVVGIDDPLEKIPIFEITPESAAVMKTPLVEVQPLPPAPRKRGRPRKVPLVVREDLDAVVKEEKVIEPVATPPVEDTGRPKRSCRGPSVRTTLGIRARRPRGSSRGRGRGRGSRGGGTRGGRQQRLSAAKLKLLKEEAASAIAEETKRLDNEQKDVEMKEEVPENVDAGTTSSELVIIEEETRMSADINSSRAQTPAKQVLTPAPGDVEDTQSSVQSTATTESVKVRKGTRLEVHQEPEGEVISAEQLAEYYWGGGGPYMLQEQVAQFLGIKSFKRKYPGITRRPVDMQERDFIRESGLASEAMCDLGLTAVSSADILDIMYSDFQHKYEEYCKHQRDRQAKDFSNKQKALSLAASQEKNKQDIMQQAVQSAASWNASFNKARKDDRKSCMDLQTFTVHYPKGKMKKIDQPKVGFYPVALVPGQYTDYYKTFTPTELNNLPLNTMLYEPININDEDSHSDGSGSDSDSSSSSSGSSSSDSSDDNCNVCSPASSTNKKAISTTN